MTTGPYRCKFHSRNNDDQYFTNLTQILKIHVDFRQISKWSPQIYSGMYRSGFLWEAFLRTSRTQRHYNTIYLRYSWSSTNLESCGMLVVFRLLDWPVLRNPGGNPRGILKILLIFWKSKSPLSSEWNLYDIGPVVVELEQFNVSQGPT